MGILRNKQDKNVDNYHFKNNSTRLNTIRKPTKQEFGQLPKALSRNIQRESSWRLKFTRGLENCFWGAGIGNPSSDRWADSKSRSTLGFCNLHHRSTRV